MTFALFGHSFIARISNHPVLEMTDSSVHFFGLSGGTSRQILLHNTTQRMIQTKPSKIYVQIGENDISFQSDPFQIVKDIARLVNTFRDIPDLEHVTVGRLFKRYRPRGDVCGGIRNPTDNYQLVLTEILPGWRTRCGPEFEWTRGMRQGGALWRCSFTQATTQSLRRRNKEDIVGVNLKALIFIVKMLVLLHADCKSILAYCFKRSDRHLLFVKFS